ncbi:NUDIX hydrolase [Conexibacter sp. SYSU D00693]|uniref:NUDIX domain-containing protein n=1 Tax=Conexibacter sp. SYSU D00693 TaxID=2812560 RepID=UPI00196B1D64|nr:NUDIX hydrolase [Conexibacter sp. SYSU D00693]
MPPGEPADPPHRVVSTRVVYENRWMRLREDVLERDDGSPGLYSVVEKPPAAVLVPVQDGRVWLVEQFRHPAQGRFWDLPQGALDAHGERPPEEVARTELEEETGLRAGRLVHLGRLFFAYGISAQPFDAFFATDLEPGEARLEETEADLRCASFSVAEVEDLLREARIVDAASHAAWNLARMRSLV